MALRDIFKINRKTFFNPTAWIDYQSLKEQNQTIYNIIRDAFKTPTPLHDETFENAMQRFGLTESDVKEGATRYRLYALAFVLLAILLFAYSFYLLFRYHTFMGLLLGLSATFVLLAQAFRYDFWSLQMRSRKLGLTFEDWKNSVLSNKGSSE